MSEARVREHLANERTLLAWVRTGISLMGFGVVIAKLRFLVVTATAAQTVSPQAGTHSTLLGLGFAGVGLLTLVFAAIHYEHTRRAIEDGDYQPSGRILTAFVAVLFLLGIASVAYLLALSPH